MQICKRLVYTLYFPDMALGPTGEFIFRQENGSSKLTWLDYGDVADNPLYRYFVLFMEKMMGRHFETCIHNLKLLTESQNEN